jgi:hypothetical protein
MQGRIKPYSLLQAPYINVKVKVIQPGTTNGKPNIKEENKYVVSPSAKKIATYIRNQIFGSDLVTQTEGLDINWLMPTLSESLEKAIYQEESFIYLHKFDNKVYLECLNKCDIHDLVQKYDKVLKGTIVQEFETDKEEYELRREIEITEGTSIVKFKAFRIKDNKDYIPITLDEFNSKFDTDYIPIYNLPYEVLINIDIGQDFFKDSENLLNEEMEIFNTINEEVEKTKTRIATTQHYQTTDITMNWKPNNNFNVQQMSVGKMQDFFTLIPGDKEHAVFEFLQGDIRIQQYIDTFKFLDYQIIQMAGLSPASFGYEKDAYMNTANIDLSANASEMTIEAIKKQIEPQINKLIENIIKLQQSQNMTENLIPSELVWDYGDNERLDDMRKLEVLQAVQRTASVPYSIRSKIITPILNKLIDEKVNDEDVTKAYEEESQKMNIEFGEI